MTRKKTLRKKTKPSLRRTISKKAKRVQKSPKLRKIRAGNLLKIKVMSSINLAIHDLHQELTTQINLLRKETTKTESQLKKTETQKQKSENRLKNLETKGTTKDISANKRQLKLLKTESEKLTKSYNHLQKELDLLQNKLNEYEHELDQLHILETHFKHLHEDWQTPSKQEEPREASAEPILKEREQRQLKIPNFPDENRENLV